MLHRHVSEAFLIIIMVIRIIEQHSGVFKTFAINLTYYYSNAITYLNALLLRGYCTYTALKVPSSLTLAKFDLTPRTSRVVLLYYVWYSTGKWQHLFVYPDSDERRICGGEFSRKSIFLRVLIFSTANSLRPYSIGYFFLLKIKYLLPYRNISRVICYVFLHFCYHVLITSMFIKQIVSSVHRKKVWKLEYRIAKNQKKFL